ncbi:MAG: hypothetical protein WBD63_04930 [Phycisphaerae bacterium]
MIVVNQYNTTKDTTPDAKGVTMNGKFIFSGIALKEMYAEDSNGRTVLLTCGLNGNIQQIDQLPGYLSGLNPPVAYHSVSTYDTLGHGDLGKFTIKKVTEIARVMEGARQPWNQVDTVGHSTDLAIIQLGNPSDWHPLPVPDYADLIRPFLRDDAIVNLLHCFTGEPYSFFADATGENIVERTSLAAQIKSTTPPLPSGVISAGISGNCACGGGYADDNGNGRWDPEEPVIGRMPRPDGGTWQVVETP